MNQPRRATAHVAIMLMAWLLLFVAPTPAHAAQDEAPQITWAVSPANEDGPDGRARVSLTADPGDTIVEHVAVQNLSKVPVTFAMSSADGYFTDKGRFNMLPATVPSVDAGTWVSIAETVDIDAGQTAILPYRITIPDNATPGDHVAGLVASYTSGPGGAQELGVLGRVGFRIEIRVTGTLTPALDITNVKTTYQQGWNPFKPGTVDVEAVLTNSGNTALVIDTAARVHGTQAPLGHVDGAPTVELLPGDSTTVRGTIEQVWPLFRLTTEVVGEADPGSGLPTLSQSATQTAWAWPLPQLVVLAGTALIILGLVDGRRRSRRRLRTMLEAARAQGRHEVLDDAVEPSGS